MNNEGLETTSKKNGSAVQDAEIVQVSSANVSPGSKRLLDMQKDIAGILECRRTEKVLRVKYNLPH